MSLTLHLIPGGADQAARNPVLALALMQKETLNPLSTTSASNVHESGSSRNQEAQNEAAFSCSDPEHDLEFLGPVSLMCGGPAA